MHFIFLCLLLDYLAADIFLKYLTSVALVFLQTIWKKFAKFEVEK